MALSGSVDFVIKATDLTSKPTQDIVSALRQLDEAQQGVIDSAGNVTKSTADMVAEQEALLKVSKELDTRLKNITAYEKNEEKIKELTSSLDTAKSKYSEFSKELFNAQASGAKTAIDTATGNLKAANTVITQTQTQLDRLTRSQEKLRTQSLERGGVDLTRGGTARAATEAARDTVEKQRQLNIQLQEYAREQAQEVELNRQAEARKQAAAKESAEFQKQLDQASSQNQRNEYARMYAALLDEQEVKLKEIADQENRAAAAAAARAAEEKKAADQLERFQEIGARAGAALDISQHSRVAPTASAASTSASSAVQAAIDPLKAQLSTLNGVEAALTDVEAKIKEVATTSGTAASKIESLTAQEKQLDQINKSLGAQAGFIDKLNTQNAAVDTARARMEAAEAEVRKWAAAIQNATAPNDAMLVFLQQAQGRLQGATSSFNTQSATLERLTADAKAAGVAVDQLDKEEAQLVSTAQRAAAAQRQVGEALEQSGKGGTGLLAFIDKFNAGGRTTLSFTQRLRGELLSLTATYVGLQAAVRGAGAVLDAVNTSQSVKAQIAQTTDSPQQAKSQFEFLLNEANRTSTSFDTVAEGYRTMVRQAREFGLSQEATNKLFSDALTVSRSYNQTQEQLQGTMLALGQIFDKGTIQAQEFKQQLSNAGLAGLFPVLQKVMKDQGITSINDLRKAMEAGTISAANMGLVFDELAKSGQTAFNANMNTWSAQVGRFKTQLFVLENQFAESGFLTAVSEGLDRVSELLKDPATQQNIQELGREIGELIAFFAELATDTDVLHAAFTAFEVYLATKFLFTIVSVSLEMGKLSKATTGLTAEVPGLTSALGVSSKAGLWGAAVGAGIGLGILLDKIPAVHNAIENLANAPFWETLKNDLGNLRFDKVAQLLVVKGVSAQTEATLGRVDELTGEADKQRARKAQIDALDAETAKLREINVERTKLIALGDQATASDKARLQVLNDQAKVILNPANKIFDNKATPPARAAAVSGLSSADEEYRRLSQESGLSATTDLILKIDKATNEKVLKSQKDFLGFYQEQYKSGIEAAERSVANARIADEKNSTEASRRLLSDATKNLANLNLSIKKRADVDYQKSLEASGKKAQETSEAFAHKEVTLHEQTNALKLASDKQLADLGAKIQDDSLKARLASVDAEIAQINEKYAVQIRKNSDAIAAGQKIGGNVSQLQADNVALAQLQKELSVRKANAELIATQKFNLDEAKKAEDAINAKLQLRTALLSAIEEQRKAGLISTGQARDQTKQVNAQTLGGAGGIDALLDSSIADLTQKIQAAGPATTEYTQKLELLRAQMIALKAATDASAVSVDQFSQTAGQAFAGAITSSVTSFVQEIAKAGAGVESLGSAWAKTRDVMRNAVADMLQQIAIYIIKMQIVKALESASSSSGGGMWGTLFSAAASALGGGGSKAHTGAVVGAGGVGGATPMAINPAWFIGAPRFHTGGLPGLAPDEYPIIAQKGEEILSKDNPRNVLNGGGDKNTAQVGAPGGDVNLHMHADAGSFFSAGLSTKRGQKDFFVFFEANRSKFSKLVR